MSRLTDRLQLGSHPASQVSPEEYARLLGYPVARPLEGSVLALAEASRDWYRRHARPWIFGREVGIARIDDGEIHLEGGATLRSAVLARRLRRSEAESSAVVAVSAGPEVDERVADLWRGDRPDEAFFLDRFGAATAERLAAVCGEVLRDARETDPLAAIRGYSPGYVGWDLRDQVVVHGLLTAGRHAPLPGPLTALESGMLTPRSSLIAVFGLTPRRDLATRTWSGSRCGWCSSSDCGFRHIRLRHERP